MAFEKKKNTSEVHKMGTAAKANSKGGGKGSFDGGRGVKDFKDGKLATGSQTGPQASGGRKYANADFRPDKGDAPTIAFTSAVSHKVVTLSLTAACEDLDITKLEIRWEANGAFVDQTIVPGEELTEEIEHTYAAAGTFAVTAVVTTETGRSAHVTHNVTPVA